MGVPVAQRLDEGEGRTARPTGWATKKTACAADDPVLCPSSSSSPGPLDERVDRAGGFTFDSKYSFSSSGTMAGYDDLHPGLDSRP